jgi:Tfp pilus assembly protein PilN
MMATASVAPAPQQINLCNPSLLPKRESFTARHIIVWGVIASLAMAVLGWWASAQIQVLRREVAEQAARHASEKALAAVPRLASGEVAPTPQEVSALEQALRGKQSALEARRGVRDVLKRGLAGPNSGPSALLRLFAATLPPSAWLTEVRVAGARLEVVGKALDPAAVDHWLERVRTEGFLASTPMPAVRLERIDAPAPAGGVVPVYLFNVSAALASPFAEEGARP